MPPLFKIFHYLLSFQQAVLLTSTKLATKRFNTIC
nr:MAG TPA: hypothetical protein [Caudoviricetes sp.]